MKIDSIQLINDLSNANGISGFENEVLDVIEAQLKEAFDINEQVTN